MCKFRQLKKKLINDFYKAENIVSQPVFSDASNNKNQSIFAISGDNNCEFKSEDTLKNNLEYNSVTGNNFIASSNAVSQDAILQKNTNKNVFSNNRKFDARFVWGSLIVKLRQENYMTLHTACGEIRDLKIENNVVNVFVKEEYLYNILKKEENCATLTKLLREIDQNLSLNFVFVKKTEDKALKNLEILKNIFGDDLILK